MLPRFYCDPASHPLAAGSPLSLPGEAAHHAARVLRLRAGDALVLFDGKGGEYAARVIDAGKDFRVMPEAFCDRECEAPLSITLVQALPGGDKMDWIVQKAVELGATAIQPVQTKRSVVRLIGDRGDRAAKRVAHWRQVAVSACEQSGRNRIPEIREILDLAHYLGRSRDEKGYMLSPNGAHRITALPHPQNAVAVLIGPEGGFDDAEEDMARAAGFQAVRLGARVMRTETAGLAAIAAMMTRWGDF